MIRKKISLIVLALVIVLCLILLVACKTENKTEKFTLTVTAAEGGTVSSTGGDYDAYDSVTVTATPNDSYDFDGWYEGNTKVSANKTYNFYMPDKNLSLEARFVSFHSGNGTSVNPYVIMTKEQLINFANLVNTGENYSLNKYFALGADVNLGNMEWTPIGCDQDKKAFQGNFDGQDYKVTNFKITKVHFAVGFFGYTYNSTIKNLSVTNCTINITNQSTIYAGGLIGCNENSTISQCNAKGNVSVNCDYASVGGLIGENSGNITNCYATVNILVTSKSSIDDFSCVGGLIGRIYSCDNIVNSYATGDISYTGGHIYLGGLVGYYNNLDVDITNCYATGNISAEGSVGGVGGLLGYFLSNADINIVNCYATGNIDAKNITYVGGLIGRIIGNVTNCYATGNVIIDGYGTVGGLIGRIGGNLTNCYATGNVIINAIIDGDGIGGGLIGSNYGDITNCYCYDGQTVDANTSNNLGNPCSLFDLNSQNFYVSTLNWSTDIWDFTNLDFENGKYPKLKWQLS